MPRPVNRQLMLEATYQAITAMGARPSPEAMRDVMHAITRGWVIPRAEIEEFLRAHGVAARM